MINYFDHSSFLNSRNKTIIDFIYSTGSRVSEVINVNLSDIDLKESFVRLEGKGAKQRIVPLGSLLINNLNDYIKFRESIKNIKSSKLFLSKSFKSLDRTAVFRLVKSTGIKLGLSTDLHPHTLRHSAATHMLEGGCDLRTVQEFLGHSSVSTTQIYTKVTKEFLEEAFTESHPRS
jgi:integrase/recombinase XerD